MARKKGTPHKIDITDQSFGKWTVINRFKHATWQCKCSCGAEHIVRGSHLKSGKSTQCKSCATKTHGMTKSPIYKIWEGMKRRCETPSMTGYSDYGGRGIKVCERWQKFENFFADMGDRPDGMSIDRIDNNGNYEPSNCVWASVKEQARNRRSSILHTCNGKTATIAEWAEIKGMPARQLRLRMATKGLTLEEALELPYKPRK